MGSSPPPSRLTKLQCDLLGAFFAREQRLFLTGGGALAGFYFGHRDTEDLDLFSPPGPDLRDAERAMREAALSCGALAETTSHYPDFRRLLVSRGDERCVVDLVIDRAPMVEPQKATFGPIRVDTLREIAANKICTILGRCEIKDLVDLKFLVQAGIDLEQAFADAEKKDSAAEPATLGWLLEQMVIAPTALLPGDVDPAELDRFRQEIIPVLRRLAYTRARRS